VKKVYEKTLQQKGRRLWDNKEGGLDGKKLHKMKIKRCLKLLFRQTLYALVDFEWEVRVLFMVLFCLHYAPQTKHVFFHLLQVSISKHVLTLSNISQRAE